MMTRASNKADGIAYSWHDMPLEFSSSKGNLKNYYSANGTKLKTVVEPAGGGDVSTIHYFSGIEYKDEELHTAYWSDGRANFVESEAQHEYYLKDHLGNTRVRFADKKDPETGEADGIITYDPSDPENDEVLSTHQYYPFDDRLIIATAIKKVIRNHFLRREPKTLLRVGGWDVPNVDSNGNSLLPTDGETKYTYNGNEIIDDLGLDLMDFNARTYDPAIGRFLQVDPLAEDMNQVRRSVYSSMWNNPIRYDDPDGECPWCIGALVGAAIDYGSQVAVNVYNGKSVGDALTDVDGKSILVSAAAGATGVGIAQGIKNFGTAAKIATEIVTDAAISATSQVINEGEVDLTNVAVDAVVGQAARNTVGTKVKNKAAQSSTGQKMQVEVNQQKNIARGKSRQQGVKKTDSNVPAAQNKLDNYTSGSGAAGAGAAAGSVRKAINPPTNDEENN